jgi:hypothetical protein
LALLTTGLVVFFEAFVTIINTLNLVFVTLFVVFEAVLTLVTVAFTRVGTGSVRGT